MMMFAEFLSSEFQVRCSIVAFKVREKSRTPRRVLPSIRHKSYGAGLFIEGASICRAWKSKDGSTSPWQKSCRRRQEYFTYQSLSQTQNLYSYPA